MFLKFANTFLGALCNGRRIAALPQDTCPILKYAKEKEYAHKILQQMRFYY